MKQIKIDYTASIAELKELYLTAKTAYYEDAAPLFSDVEFDNLQCSAWTRSKLILWINGLPSTRKNHLC